MAGRRVSATRDERIAGLRALLGDGAVVAASDDLERYEKGWRYGRGRALAGVRPSSTEEVSLLLRHAFANGIRVVTQGANTGLVGASTPDESGGMVVLSLERLARTVDVDPVERTVTADGGVLLSRIDAALAGHGLLFPIDLGADPSIGGMVATNTGGTRLLRYGDVRRNLLGLEAVLVDGTVLDLTRPLRKNNTGFDARQLFVGTSGAFGVVTKVVMSVVPRPVQRVTAFVGLTSGAAVLGLLAHLEGRLGEVLTAFEAIGAEALAPVFRRQPRLRDPFGGRLPAYAVLVELSSTLGEDRLSLGELLESALAERLEAANGGGVTDVFPGRPSDLWEIRHGVSESLRQEGEVLAFDISVPRSELAAFVETARETVAAGWPFIRFCDYGHWGDGGVHVNLVWDAAGAPRPSAELRAELQPRLYDLAVVRFRGSYSAEHGVGPHNQAFYDLYTPEVVKELCRLLKERLDPSGLLGRVRLG